MQIVASRTSDAPTRWSIVIGTLVGAILLIGGITVAVLAFGTPFISRFTPGFRPEGSQVLAGMLAWTFALIAPSAFMMAGLARIVAVFDSVSRARSRVTAAVRSARALSDDYVAFPRLPLPDGRPVREVVLGPFGVAVINELPPSSASRHRNGFWEVRVGPGRWLPVENPLERTGRDAERVRHWLAGEDSGFTVKVYAAIVAPDTTLPRTPACAVVTADQISTWLASLPVQRSLTVQRRERVLEILAAAR